MSTTTLAAYLLSAMQAFYPEASHSWTETPEVTHARYEAFAYEVAWAVEQPYVLPLFKGDDTAARAKSALVLVSIAADESRYIAVVLDCHKGGDGGKSWGPFQTTRDKAVTCSGIPGAVRVALGMVLESFHVCSRMPLENRLAEYTDGLEWKTEKAAKRSQQRLGRALRYWKETNLAATAGDAGFGGLAIGVNGARIISVAAE
jgi:hypothetical protein